MHKIKSAMIEEDIFFSHTFFFKQKNVPHWNVVSFFHESYKFIDQMLCDHCPAEEESDRLIQIQHHGGGACSTVRSVL